MSASPDIFLSYNREDADVARRFAEGFEAAGFDVWWDKALRSGEAYDEVTEAALRGAKAVVVLWSKRSVVSRWVRAEATLADRNRTLVPARIEPCDLPIMFELTQTAELSHWQGDNGDSAWSAFLDDVKRMVGKQQKTTRPLTAVAAKEPSRGRKPSIAVLPFINRSELREDEIFANCMVDDLTVALSISRKMKVVAASATAAYRKEARDLRQIGRDLGVRYLLEGNVRRAGDDLRVTAQLVEAETDDILWTQRFDRPLPELADLQEELVAEVAAHLGVQVQRAEIEHALKKPGDISVLEALLRSDYHLFKGTRSGSEKAVAEAKHAVEIEPDYGPAYAVLAAAQASLLRSTGGDNSRLARQVEDTIRKARSFDPKSPLVLCRIAAAYHLSGNPLQALPIAELAVTLNPNNEMIRQELAAIYILLGRADEAIAELDAADRLAPNGPWLGSNAQNRSVAHLQANRLEHAIQEVEKSVRLFSGPEALIQRVLCLALSGHRDDARIAVHRLHEADSSISLPLVERSIGEWYDATGKASEYIEVVRKIWHATEDSG